MSSELRWILLIIGVAFVAALAVWERRRPRQASASSASERPAPRDLRHESTARARQEPKMTLPEITPQTRAAHELPVLEFDPEPETDEVPVLTPLTGSQPDTAAEPLEDSSAATAQRRRELAAPETGAPGAAALGDADDSRPYVPRIEPAPAPPAASRAALPQLPPAAAPVVEWPPDAERHIVALRLVAPQPQRFQGRSLRQALAAEGFILGRFAIFHKPDEAHRAVLSAASLNRPGTFDADTMDTQQYGGLSLFAVLPGPRSPPQAFDELVSTARSLNERLQGVLQDEQGGPLTPSRIASLRERLNSGAAP